ncbi:MAG: fatty acid desaturase [Byssovorax sp.]
MEPAIEQRLRRRPWLVPFLTAVTGLALYAALAACLFLYRAGHPSIIVLSGLLAHAIMVVWVHDGAHRSITRGPADRWIVSIAAGLLLMPLYGEAFRKYHLLHHKHTNTRHDPLFSPGKVRLFQRHRLVYMALDVIPMLLTFACPAELPEIPPGETDHWRIERRYLCAGLIASGLVIALALPDLGFCAGTIVSLYAWATVRDWCEHFGPDPRGFANAYRFPLGMGIGNHGAHHDHPSLSWIAMALGLRERPKVTGPLRAAWRMARGEITHYMA